MIKKEVKQTVAARYFEATGGRKTARAIARIFHKKGNVTINNKDYKEYFKNLKNQMAVSAPFQETGMAEKLSATVKITGGGINAQAEAVRNAIAKAMVKLDAELKKPLRRAGFVTRDSRMVERKKYGYKKARRAAQWAKR